MDDPTNLLREAVRIAATAVVIKDHTRNGFLTGTTLRIRGDVWRDQLGLYPPLLGWPFERFLHFIARLDVSRREGATTLARCGTSPASNP